MDDEELALYFAAKKENEELRETILNDHREIERLNTQIVYKELDICFCLYKRPI